MFVFALSFSNILGFTRAVLKFQMPCYNYCPIANVSNRAKPKAEEVNGDCECGDGRGGCGSGGSGSIKSCGSSPATKTSVSASASTSGNPKPRLLPREGHSTCPMMGDIENWPPVYSEEDVQVLLVY